VFESVSGQILTHGSNADYRIRLDVDRAARPVDVVAVHHGFFDLLGLSVKGRDFTRDDDRRGAEPVAIIADSLWRNAFGADPSVIGSVISARPTAIRIVGVAPDGFTGARRGERTDVWVPSGLMPALAVHGRAQGDTIFLALARLRTGIQVADADRALAELYRGRRAYMTIPLDRLFGSTDDETVVVEPDSVLRSLPMMSMLVLLAGLATLVALTAVHYDGRREEFAIRSALGASSRHIAGQLGREAALIVGFGSLLAALVVTLGLGAFPAVRLPNGVDLARLEYRIDWRLFALAVSLSTMSVALALVGPLARASRKRVVSGNQLSGRATRASSRLDRSVLTIQTAAALMLVALALSFLDTISHARGPGSGFDSERTIFAEARVQRTTVARRVDERLRSTQIDMEFQASCDRRVCSSSVGPSGRGACRTRAVANRRRAGRKTTTQHSTTT
jgi:hypothetical protein